VVSKVLCLTVCLVALSTGGCGGPQGPTFAPVEGRVAFAGKPVTSGEIFFAPDISKGADGPLSVGAIRPDGSYSLRGPGGRVGAVVGSHRVYLAMPGREAPEPPLVVDGKVVPRDDAAVSSSPRGLPDRLFTPDSSGLTAHVVAGEVNTIDFDIAR